MRIQHNITAMNAYRNYTNNTSAVSKNLEKLSSGYKINRAGDDAAGLAISEKMRAQVTGLKTAQKNAKDGVSLVKTGEGALTEVHDMLNRMYELAEQSSNGTYDNEVDRANLQKEVNSLKTEIDRIADSVNFNGINLLDGSLAGGASGTGSLKGGVITSFKPATSGVKAGQDLSAFDISASAAETVTIDGVDISVDWSKLSTDDQAALKKDWKTASTATDAKKAAEIMQKAINDAIDATNAEKGTSVQHVTVKGTDDSAGAGSFEIISGLEGSGNSSIKIGADPTGANNAGVLNKLMRAPAGTGSFSDGMASANSVVAALADVDLSSTIDGGAAAKCQALTSITIEGVALTLASDWADGFSDGATAGSDVITALQTAINNAITTKNADNATGTASYTKLGNVTVTAKGSTGVNINGQHTPVTYSAGAAADGPINVSATNKFSGDIADVNTVKFDMMLGGESVEMNVANIVTGDNGAHVASELKNGIDAALNNYGASKGITGADLTALKASITVGFNSEGRLEITNNSGMSLSFEDKDGGKAAQTLGISNSASQVTSGGLTLQIGDTSDSFNKLTVSINDMHAAAMGIGGVDISNQTGASAAMKAVKAAINYVSDTRGDLGATQNRLEHTINNLSVMQENIQDAESSIRDVDVAEEMMAYTKNNILVQSAQAMLAQANQLPQGVLQLLQ